LANHLQVTGVKHVDHAIAAPDFGLSYVAWRLHQPLCCQGLSASQLASAAVCKKVHATAVVQARPGSLKEWYGLDEEGPTGVCLDLEGLGDGIVTEQPELAPQRVDLQVVAAMIQSETIVLEG
jgi:hypothetical protein